MSLQTTLLALATAGSLSLTALAPALATPLGQRPSVAVTDIGTPPQKIQDRGSNSREWSRDRRNYDRQRSHTYYNGHRGYAEPRSGYRERNGLWFPPAAFALGALITGAIQGAGPQPTQIIPGRALSNTHTRWCQGRYRSYSLQTNTFQPYNGPRRACVSPYWP